MSKKKETFNEAIVGVFMTAVILLLAYFTIVISGVDVLRGDRKVEMTVVFDQVGGLKDHDNVMYRGTKVGTIDDVRVTPSNLVVTAVVDRNVVLRENCRVAVCNLSMLGGNYLLLEEGTGEIVDLASTTFAGETPTDWMRDVSKIAANVRTLTEMKELKSIVTNVANVAAKADSFMSKADSLATAADRFMQNANKVADDISLAVTEARTFIDRSTTAATTINTAAEKADSVLAKLNRDKMFDDLEAGIAAFRTAAESFDATDVMGGASNVMAKAGQLLDDLTVVSAKLKDGEGSLGKLINNPEMYDEARGLIKDARQILDNYRDTTPISTFSSLATGAL